MDTNTTTKQRRVVSTVVKLALGMGLVMTTGTMISYYLLKRWILKQRDEMIQWQRMQWQISNRFNQTKSDTGHTVVELMPVMSLVFDNHHDLNIDDLFRLLKSKKNGIQQNNNDNVSEDHRSKAELWEDLKLKSLIKLVTEMYTLVALYLLVSIQLNILARRDYLENAINEAIIKETVTGFSVGGIYNWVKSKFVASRDSEDDNDPNRQLGRDKITYINEQAFLSLSWWVMNRGWEEFYPLVENIVSLRFTDLKVRDRITTEEFEQRLRTVHYNITELMCSDDNTINLATILLPDESMETYTLQQALNDESVQLLYENDKNHEILSNLLQESRQYLQMDASYKVFIEMAQHCLEDIIPSIIQTIKTKSRSDHGNADDNTNSNAKFPLAMFIIGAKDHCSGILSRNDNTNTTVQAMSQTAQLEEFASGIYCNFEL